MEIIFILAFVALVAVIFGVSMHEAFWGIILFIVGAIFVSFLVCLAKAGMVRIGKKIEYLETPEGKKAQKKKMQEFCKDLFWGIVILGFLSPLPCIVLAEAILPKDTPMPAWVPFLIGMVPFMFSLCTVIVLAFKQPKKRARKKTR